jgi:hypothetical protein
MNSMSTAPNDWENLAILQRNRLPSRAAFIPYLDEQTALRYERLCEMASQAARAH